MKLLLCFLAANIGQSTDSSQTNPTKPATTTQPSAVVLDAATSSKNASKGIMAIDPKLRSADLMQAFEVLRREKTTAKVIFQLANGKLLSNIIEMSLMTNGSIILFRYNTPQGIQLQVVPTEEIVSLYHLP